MVPFEGTARFHVLRQLGAGGMGVVYEALDLERNERVALKTLNEMDADALLRFKREFRALHGIEQALRAPPLYSTPSITSTSASPGGLTPRELEIARLIASGRSNKAIGAELVISPATVARHVANIMAKLGFRSRAQIAAWITGSHLPGRLPPVPPDARPGQA